MQPRPLLHAGGAAGRRPRRRSRSTARRRRGAVALVADARRLDRRSSRSPCGRTRTRRTTPPSSWRRAPTPTATSTSPNLFIRRWAGRRPGPLGAHRRLARWRSAGSPPGGAGAAGAAGSAPADLAARARRRRRGALLAAGLVLEQWPGQRTAPAFPEAMPVAAAGRRPRRTPRAVLFVSGAAQRARGRGDPRPGPVDLLVRAPSPGREPPGDGRRAGRRPAGGRPAAARPAPDRGAPRPAASSRTMRCGAGTGARAVFAARRS